ncbi:MAG: molybdopterin-dependent oxidoreductase, partial [Actinobacteria bacterium]|nr:molybdopterin-dependent oxidoreductase [Actinomycetota bacterium]
MTNSLKDVGQADVILLTGTNTVENHPVIAQMIKTAALSGDTKLIVVDPRDISMARYAEIRLRPGPGTDVAWLNGMAQVIISEGLWDKEFVEKRTEGFEEFRRSAKEYTPDLVHEITGIRPAELRKAARLYASAPSAAIYYAMGITQHVTGTDNVMAIANLAMLTGNIGRPGTGVNPLRGQNNVQGACDLGALPNVFPGYQKVADDTVRKKFEKAWGVKL